MYRWVLESIFFYAFLWKIPWRALFWLLRNSCDTVTVAGHPSSKGNSNWYAQFYLSCGENILLKVHSSPDLHSGGWSMGSRVKGDLQGVEMPCWSSAMSSFHAVPLPQGGLSPVPAVLSVPSPSQTSYCGLGFYPQPQLMIKATEEAAGVRTYFSSHLDQQCLRFIVSNFSKVGPKTKNDTEC